MKATALVRESFSRGWETFTKRPWFLIGSVIAVFAVSVISGGISQGISESGSSGAIVIANILDFFVVQIFVSMGLIMWSLKASASVETLRLADLWVPHAYWKFLGATLLATIIEVIGFVLLIIPGIIASVLLLFAPFFVIDRGAGPIDAIKMSFDMVKGHFWGVFLFMFCAIVINIVGAILFGVGLLLTIPVTVIAIAHAYRILVQMPTV